MESQQKNEADFANYYLIVIGAPCLSILLIIICCCSYLGYKIYKLLKDKPDPIPETCISNCWSLNWILNTSVDNQKITHGVEFANISEIVLKVSNGVYTKSNNIIKLDQDILSRI